MNISILEDYDFIYPLVKDNLLNKDGTFLKGGLCFTDDKKRFIYVFHILDNEIWATYGYAKIKNKDFLEFHKKVSDIIFSFDLPVLRIGKNDDFKNHTFLKEVTNDGIEIFQFKST